MLVNQCHPRRSCAQRRSSARFRGGPGSVRYYSDDLTYTYSLAEKEISRYRIN